MARTIISANYPPLIDPTRATLAFGRKALPVLVYLEQLRCKVTFIPSVHFFQKRDLESKTLITRQRAMMALADYLHDPEHIADALRHEFIDLLLNAIHDEDVIIKQKAAECFYLFANHAVGRQAMIDNEVISSMTHLLHDPEPIVRLNAYKAIEITSEMSFAADAILEAKMIALLIKNIKSEHTEMKHLIMDTLHFCFKINVQQALDGEGMAVFYECLYDPDVGVRWRGARNIADLCQVLEGKEQAIEVMCVYRLVEMLSDSSLDIKINATNALMRIALTTKGKYTVLEAKAVPPLLDLLNEVTSEIKIYSLKTLTCISEAPEGRKMLLEHVPQIRLLQFDTLPSISRAATIAVSKILWKP